MAGLRARLAAFIVWLLKALEAKPVPGPATSASPVYFKSEGSITMAQITVSPDVEPFGATVRFLDADGNEATPDTTPTWASSDESVATVAATSDGLEATVTVGGSGATVISVETTETNTGETIRAEGTVTVQDADVVSGEVTFDTGSEEAPL